MAGQTNCESCANYIYDEESDCYCCEVDLDEDEMYRFLSDTFYQCPYYQLDDEYRIVRKPGLRHLREIKITINRRNAGFFMSNFIYFYVVRGCILSLYVI